ncbi:4Fe-4S binding protein [bacterium]|nr:4Fe-4S binding protein [bacterium]
MKKLFIDLEVCRKHPEVAVPCSYFYHPDNKGVVSLRELAAFAIICRQCDEAPCVKSCPQDALEKQEDGTLKRYNMLCISCKSCAYACPFGTIIPEVIPYAVSQCDYCLDRLAEVEEPLCVKKCPVDGMLYCREVEEDHEKNIFFVGEHLAVHARHWEKVEAEVK